MEQKGKRFERSIRQRDQRQDRWFNKTRLHQSRNNVYRQMKVDKTKEVDHLTTEIVLQDSTNIVVLKETVSKIKETIKTK